jgi:hypothetical protein
MRTDDKREGQRRAKHAESCEGCLGYPCTPEKARKATKVGEPAKAAEAQAHRQKVQPNRIWPSNIQKTFTYTEISDILIVILYVNFFHSMELITMLARQEVI